jgi:hypothetical protein
MEIYLITNLTYSLNYSKIYNSIFYLDYCKNLQFLVFLCTGLEIFRGFSVFFEDIS